MSLSQIEDRYLTRLAEYDFPGAAPEPVQVAQAAGDTMTDAAMQMTVGTLPEDAQNMPLSTFLKMAADVPAGLLKGAFQGTGGLAGDFIMIGKGIAAALNPQADETALDAFLRGTEGRTILPTTEDLKKFLDETVGVPLIPASDQDPMRRQAGKVSETIGELGGGGTTIIEGTKAAAKAGKEVGKAVLDVTKDLPVGLSIKPVDAAGNPASMVDLPIAVKIGDREVKIPAAQAAMLSKAVKNLTPAEQSKFRSDTARTFVEYLTQLPSKQEFAAAALGGKAKKGWYEGSTQAIVTVFGPDAPRFAALLSATSPQTSVESNLYNALQIWKNWTTAGRPIDRESIIRVMGDSVQGSKGEASVLDAWKNNTVSALSAEDPSSLILSGPKVDSFMKNLQGNVNEVTNDAWMAAFALVDQNIFSGSITKTDAGKGPGYLAMNARVRETADYLTKLTGETWTPAEVQETIWSWAKTLYEKAGSAGENRSAVQLVRDSAITDELIASTPDFRTLFYDARFQPILEQAGYGDQLAQLRAATAGSDAGTGVQKPAARSKASPLDPEAARKLNERNAKRLDKLRKQREQASLEKASKQTPTGGNE